MRLNQQTYPTAVVRLRGHGAVPAHLDAARYPLWAWMARVVAFTLCWLVGSWLTLVLTFDPFVASFVLGMGMVWRGIRGRYAVRAFQGACPRCRHPLEIRPGSKISLPFPMTCYSCHHEPELLVLPRDRAA